MERLQTNVYNEIMIEHLHRYSIAQDLCTQKIVLDIACGEGYGSNLIAVKAAKVIGVDIDADVIESAKSKYKRNNLQYCLGSADKIPCQDNFFDAVVSFETIEHHNKHQEMLSEIKRVLKPGGFLLISTPDKSIYTDKKKNSNKFHVKELYKEEFRSLLCTYFTNVTLFKQQSFFSSLIIEDEKKDVGTIKFYQGNFSSISSSREIESLYLIAIASNNAVLKLNTSLFIDDITKYQEILLKRSTRYQFGNLILNPIQFFKEKFFTNRKSY
jgi:SAM-dependent methyltransferase